MSMFSICWLLSFFVYLFSQSNDHQQLVEANQSDALRLDLESERVIVLDANEAKTQGSEILESHNIPNIKSSDLRRRGSACPTSPIPISKPFQDLQV